MLFYRLFHLVNWEIFLSGDQIFSYIFNRAGKLMTAKLKPVIEADPLQGFKRKRSISNTSGGTLLMSPPLALFRHHAEPWHLPACAFPLHLPGDGSRESGHNITAASTDRYRVASRGGRAVHAFLLQACQQSSTANVQNLDGEQDRHPSLSPFLQCFWSHSPRAFKQILSGTADLPWALAFHVLSDVPSEVLSMRPHPQQ